MREDRKQELFVRVDELELGPVLAKAGVCPSDIAGLRFTVHISETDPIPVLSGEAVLVSGNTVAL